MDRRAARRAGWEGAGVELTDVTGPLAPGGDHDLERFAGLDLTGQDASGSRFTDCALEDCVVEDVRLDDVRLVDGTLDRLRAGTLHAPGSTWQDVVVRDCRLGALPWYGAELTRVQVVGGKLDYVNLRDADLTDVVLDGCVIGELELTGARAQRLVVRDCAIRRLDVARATLRDVDLRGADLSRVDGIAGLSGATISEDQLVALAPALAAHLGMTVA